MLLLVKACNLVHVRRHKVEQVQEQRTHSHSHNCQPPVGGTCLLHCGDNQTKSGRRQHHAGTEPKHHIVPLMGQLLDAKTDYGTYNRCQTQSGSTQPYLCHHSPVPLLSGQSFNN